MILGIDEAGRGPWAGPLVVGAVVLGCQIEGLDDSKKLTKKARELLYQQIKARALASATGWVGANEIDQIGLSASLAAATRRAVEQIKVPYHEIIIDGTVNFLKNTTKGKFVTTLAKADSLIPSVSAASIIAKVERDNYMYELGNKYPEYGFKNHVGYGVVKHRDAIKKYGVTPEHRLSFAPLSGYKIDAIKNPEPIVEKTSINSRSIGDKSETSAANALKADGYEIIDTNWKNKYCEIDIVAMKNQKLYFIEVKHRKNAKAGDGLQAITGRKLKQMEFAAKIYMNSNRIKNSDCQLVAIATAGDNFEVTDIIYV